MTASVQLCRGQSVVDRYASVKNSSLGADRQTIQVSPVNAHLLPAGFPRSTMVVVALRARFEECLC